MIEIKGEAGFVKIAVGAETVDIELFVGDGDDGYDSCMLGKVQSFPQIRHYGGAS